MPEGSIYFEHMFYWLLQSLVLLGRSLDLLEIEVWLGDRLSFRRERPHDVARGLGA